MELQEKDNFVQNSYILIVGYLVSSIISTIGAILVIRLISVEEYSLINIAYILPGILIPFGELGLNYACTNFIAKKKKNNDFKGIRNVVKITLIVKTIVGLIFTLSVVFFSVFIAKYVYHISDERIYVLIQVASLAIISSILYDTLNSIFLGAQKVKFVQIGAIIRTSSRSVFSVLLVLMGYTLLGPILGIVFSSFLVVIVYCVFLKSSFKKETKEKERIDWKELKAMGKYGYPLLFFSLIAGIHSQIFYLILTIYGFTNAVSYLDVAIISAGLIGILTKAISFSLFPVFSKLDWDDKDEKTILIDYFRFSIKFGTLLVIPVTFFVIIFSGTIFPLIYGQKYSEASFFISIYFLMFLLTSLGFLSIPAFFNGQNKTKIVFFIQLVYFSSSIFFALILINLFGVIGLVFGIIIGCLISVIYGNIMIRRNFGKVMFSNQKNTFAIFLIAILSGILIYFIHNAVSNIIPIGNAFYTILILLLSLILYFALFFILIGLFSLITNSEIDFLVNSFQKIPVLNKLVILLANFEKKIVKIGIRKK